jgi:hypothetical protein
MSTDVIAHSVVSDVSVPARPRAAASAVVIADKTWFDSTSRPWALVVFAAVVATWAIAFVLAFFYR